MRSMIRHNFRWTTIAVLSAVFLCAARQGDAGGTPGRAATRPNIVFVTVDTLRPDHLSFYGYESETAPFLARLAKRSVVFTRAVSSSSWTAPSTASLFSGQYPTKHGVIEGMGANRRRQGEVASPLRLEINRIPARTSTMPEVLRANGYRTFGLGANPNIGPEIGFSRGFDRFDRLAPTTGFAHATAQRMYEALLGWVPEIRGEEPYFVYLHFNDPHLGIGAHALGPLIDKHLLKIHGYDSQILYFDTWLEKVFEALEVDDDTILVFVSDHGEALGEHGLGGHLCCSLHREVNQILMMWSAPALGLESRRIDLNASIVDVLPTLLDLVGIEAAGDVDGRSMREILQGEADKSGFDWTDRPILAHRASRGKALESWAIIRDRYKLIEDESGETLLFDIFSDPGEVNDLSAEQPGRVEKLANELATLRGARREHAERNTVELSDDQQEQLRALGYLRD